MQLARNSECSNVSVKYPFETSQGSQLSRRNNLKHLEKKQLMTSGTGAGAAHGRTYVFLVPLLAISVLILFISCCVCMRRRDESWYSGTQTNRGLDESTIETYRKMTISENRLIPGSNDITCAICLEDYVRNDTLRFMPGCEHCFHVECIDKWLRMNRRCPICRVDL